MTLMFDFPADAAESFADWTIQQVFIGSWCAQAWC